MPRPDRRSTGIALLLMACGGGAVDGPATAAPGGTLPEIAPPDDDGPYLDDPAEEAPPGLDPETLAAAVEAVLPLVIGANAGPIRGAYAEVLADQSEGCPTWAVTGDGVPYWFDACTAETGTRFDGYAYSLVSEDLPDGEILWTGWQFFGLATVERPGGALFEATGAAGVLRGVQSDGAQVTYTYMDEGFRYSGASAGPAWLGAAGSPEVAVYTISYPETGGHIVAVEARVSVDEGPVTAVVFDEIQLGNAAAGSPCPVEPSGLVSVRAQDGTWSELYFDGVPFDRWGSGETSGCDGCATAWTKGVQIGEVCIDTDVLVNWEGSPWPEDAPE